MSAKYTFLAWDTPVKSAPLKLTLLQLANNSDDSGKSYYSIPKMAKACGVSDRTFMRKISELEEIGVLHVERRTNRPSIYTLIASAMGGDSLSPQKNALTESHGEVTECHAHSDRESHDPNNDPNTKPNNLIVEENPQRDKFEEEDLRLAEWMYQKIKITVPSAKAPNFKTWADKIRLMRERDNRTIREIAELFDWANKDSFWCVNILSPQKLRDKWTQLDAKRIKQNETSGNGSGSSSAQQAINNLRADLEGQPRGSDQTNQAFMDSNDRDLRNQMDQGVRGGTDITLDSGDWEVRS